MDNFYLIPKEGVTVRDPLTGKALPAKGSSKPKTSYWLRRVAQGDVDEVDDPAITDQQGANQSTKAKATPKGATTGDAQ